MIGVKVATVFALTVLSLSDQSLGSSWCFYLWPQLPGGDGSLQLPSGSGTLRPRPDPGSRGGGWFPPGLVPG